MKKYYLAALILIAASIIVTGCSTTKPTGQDNTVDAGTFVIEDQGSSDSSSDEYTLAEVSQHSTEADCWIAIEGKVYDVTEFIGQHPGGMAILEGCGRDSTELYNTRPMGSGTPHSANARSMLEDYEIGTLA